MPSAGDIRAGDISAGDISAGRRLSLGRFGLTVLVVWTVASLVAVFTTVNPFMPEIGLFRGSSDFFVYRDAAHHVFKGLPIYSEQLFEYHWYTYAPFSAVLFLPFDLLPSGANQTGADQYIWMAVNFILLVAVVVRCWQLLGYQVTRYLVGVSVLIALGSVWLEPVRTTIFYGQINLVLMLLILWDISRGEASRVKGVGIGLAAGIKLTPAYFIVFYLALRQWRAAATAAGTALATVIVGFVALPSDSWQYWTSDFFDSSRVDDDLDHPANQSLRGAMAKVFDEAPATWLWAILAVAIAAVSIVVAVRLYRRGELLLAVTIVGLSGAVVSPFAWSHHWVWFVPIVVYFIHRAQTSPGWWVGVFAMSAIVGSWAYKFWFEDEPRVGIYLFPARWINKDVLVNLYPVMFVPILIWAALLTVKKQSVAEAECVRLAE